MRPWLSRKRILEIVTSGNSSSNSPRTSPMDRWAAPGSAIGALEQHEAELPDLQLVAMVQHGPLDALLVDVGAVERPGIGDDVPLGGPLDRRVPAGHRDVVQHDLAVGVAPEVRL